jgi:hypothetical protein
VSKQELMAAIKRCAEKLGYVPTIFELSMHEGLARQEIRKHFGNYKMALEVCQLGVPKWAQQVTMEQLFQDWMGVARSIKRSPTLYEYERMGKYRRRQLRRFFGEYVRVPGGMALYAEEHGVADQWQDVLEQLRRPPRGQQDATTGVPVAHGEAGAADAPVYGPVIRAPGFVYGPTNENGVLCLFGAMAEELGFLIVRVQTAFPDCEAMQVIPGERLKPVKIEIEYESRNFYLHMHDPAGCDLIVCWRHNWPECPLPVIELRPAVGDQRTAKTLKP